MKGRCPKALCEEPPQAPLRDGVPGRDLETPESRVERGRWDRGLSEDRGLA